MRNENDNITEHMQMLVMTDAIFMLQSIKTTFISDCVVIPKARLGIGNRLLYEVFYIIKIW